MASTDDVSRFLATRVADVLYPGGEKLPSVVNAVVNIYPGWPERGALQEGIEAGGVHISVWPLPTERPVNTPLGKPVRFQAKGTLTLQFSVNGSIIAVRGVASALTNVHIDLDGRAFFFHFHAGITAEKVIHVISQTLPRSFALAGTVCVMAVNRIQVYATTAGTVVRELRRQIKDFQITVWAPTPELREKVGTTIDRAFSEQCHIDLDDGAPALLFYARQFDSDRAENWHVYRRDLIFSVNFATTQTLTAPEVTHVEVTLNGTPIAK